MTLRSTLATLIAEADARGRAGPMRLAGGAMLTVLSKVEPAETGTALRRRQLRISRTGVTPSAVEVAVFRRDAGVPDDGTERAYYHERSATHTIAVDWTVPVLDMPELELPLLPGDGRL